MGGKPSAPDPQKVAQAQTASNIGTAVANAYIGNADTTTPFGQTDFTKTGSETIHIDGKAYDIPEFKVVQTLSPDQQRLLDQQEAAGSNLGSAAVKETKFLNDYLARQIDTTQLPSAIRLAGGTPDLDNTYAGLAPDLSTVLTNQNPDLTTKIGANDFSADRKRVEDALFARLNPQIESDRASLDQKLANQGVTVGSKAYQNAMDDLNRSITDQRNQIVLAGGQEQSRLFDLERQKAEFGNTALNQEAQNAINYGNFQNAARTQNASNILAGRNYYNQSLQQEYDNQVQREQEQQTLREQALQEAAFLRNQPLQEISTLLHGSAPTIPQFQSFNAPRVSDVPVGSYYYQSAAINNQANAGLLGGLGSLAGGLFGLFSDRRLKENIKQVGRLNNGLAVYSYNFKNNPRTEIGLMADEVEELMPEAVMTHPTGFKMVRYDMAVQ